MKNGGASIVFLHGIFNFIWFQFQISSVLRGIKVPMRIHRKTGITLFITTLTHGTPGILAPWSSFTQRSARCSLPYLVPQPLLSQINMQPGRRNPNPICGGRPLTRAGDREDVPFRKKRGKTFSSVI
jgi:hypothetical protein